MRIASLGSFVFAGLLSVQAYAQNAAPAEKPALPAGHPVIPVDKPSLPAGHPSVPGDAAAKPALPSGHPDLSSLMAPSTQPAATSATLTIHAVQSTKGAAAGRRYRGER